MFECIIVYGDIISVKRRTVRVYLSPSAINIYSEVIHIWFRKYFADVASYYVLCKINKPEFIEYSEYETLIDEYGDEI